MRVREADMLQAMKGYVRGMGLVEADASGRKIEANSSHEQCRLNCRYDLLHGEEGLLGLQPFVSAANSDLPPQMVDEGTLNAESLRWFDEVGQDCNNLGLEYAIDDTINVV